MNHTHEWFSASVLVTVQFHMERKGGALMPTPIPETTQQHGDEPVNPTCGASHVGPGDWRTCTAAACVAQRESDVAAGIDVFSDTPVNPLPSVRFANRGEVTAAGAVHIDGPDGRGNYAVYVLHPQGGRVYVGWDNTLAVANAAAHDLNGVLAAWAELGR